MASIHKFLQEFEEKSEEPKPIGTFRLRFGKHKNQTYDWIYENDKNYVKWILTNNDDTYIKRIKKYFIERIEQDYAD